jgi:uncharacterized protein (DUF2141 family)
MQLPFAILLLAAPALVSAAAAPGGVEVRLEKMRNARGVVHICLTADSAAFPDCAKDPKAITRTIPASTAVVRFENVAAGPHALAIFHDENGNKRLDTFLGIPREGYGFSQNPVVRFGPPRFAQARFPVGGGIARLTVRMQYLL